MLVLCVLVKYLELLYYWIMVLGIWFVERGCLYALDVDGYGCMIW